MALLPSSDKATEEPWTALPTAPVPTSLLPCWLQTPPLRMKTHVAPACELSPGPPTTAVLPSLDNATDQPWAAPTPPVPTSLLPCWLQTPLELRVKTHAAPACELSPGPPTMAVLPSAESATDMPCWPLPTAPVPTSLLPCWLQTPLLAFRVKIQAAPTPELLPALELSSGPPTMAVLPSPDSATDMPC